MTARKLKPQGLVFSAERKDLLEAVEAAHRAIGRGSDIPILGCLRLATSGGHVTVTGTDLDMEVQADASAMVEAEGEAVVSAELLLAAVKAAGTEPRLELGEKHLVIRSTAGEARIMARVGDDFPQMPLEGEQGPTVTFPGECLHEALQRVRAAISTEETRYYLNGVFVELPDQEGKPVLLTATNGHKLHHVVVEAAQVEQLGGPYAPRTGILPRRAVLAAMSLPQSVTLQLRAGRARLTSGPVCLTTRLIDGTYPDYRAVVPTPDGRHRVAFARKELIAAVNAVRWADDAKARAVKLELQASSLRLSSRRADGEASASTELAAELQGDLGEVGFNAAYLIPALEAMPSDRVTLVGANGQAPWLILDEARPDDRMVVMPMRV